MKILRQVNKDTKGHTLYLSIYIKYPEQANPQRQINGCQEQEQGKMGFTGNEFGVSLWGDENFLKWIMMMIAQL